LILEPAPVWREPKDRASSEDPEGPSDYLFECINQPAMTIWRQSLQILEGDGADKNDSTDKDQVSRVRKGKQGAKDCEPDDVLKMSVKPYFWSRQKRRKPVIYSIYESDMG
jgi:hypothetical protein